MATHRVVDIMSMLFLTPEKEYEGTVMKTTFTKLAILQEVYILDRVTKKLQWGNLCLA